MNLRVRAVTCLAMCWMASGCSSDVGLSPTGQTPALDNLAQSAATSPTDSLHSDAKVGDAKPVGEAKAVDEPQAVAVPTAVASPNAATEPKAVDDMDISQPAAAAPASPLRVEGNSRATQNAAPDAEAVRALAQVASVRIEHPVDGLVGCGAIVATSRTGFDVVTADHLLTAPEPYSVVTWQRQTDGDRLVERIYRTLKVMFRDPTSDLAYLRITTSQPPQEALDLADATGQSDGSFEAWVVRPRTPGPMQPELMTVEVNQLARRSTKDKPVSYWRLDRAVEKGMSGGPLISQSGQLIGIASGNSLGHAFYCDTSELAKFFERAGLIPQAKGTR